MLIILLFLYYFTLVSYALPTKSDHARLHEWLDKSFESIDRNDLIHKPQTPKAPPTEIHYDHSHVHKESQYSVSESGSSVSRLGHNNNNKVTAFLIALDLVLLGIIGHNFIKGRRSNTDVQNEKM